MVNVTRQLDRTEIEDNMPDQELRYQDCYFIREGDIVTLGNSRIERAWRVEPDGGLATFRILDKRTGRNWAADGVWESMLTTECGGLWFLSGMGTAEVSCQTKESIVSETSLRASFHMAENGLSVSKVFDIYPDSPAIRAFVTVTSDTNRSNLDYSHIEYLALGLSDTHSTAVELHDLTDVTNHLATVRELDDLAELRRAVGNYLFVEKPDGQGIFAYKESPVPNSQLYPLYYDFEVDAEGLSCVGAGFHNLPAGQMRRTYAFAIGVYTGGSDGGILALKEYQQARYKLVPERDHVISANSWGDFSVNINEANMLAEVEAAAEMGVTSIAVDAGWTRYVMGGDPNPETFPNGFGPLTARARELGVTLELWMVPNRLNDQLDILKEHPDWIARTNDHTPCDTWPTYWGNTLVGIELFNPDCFKWMKDYFLSFYDSGFHRFKIDTYQCNGYDTLKGDLYDHYEALRRLMHELADERPGLTFTQDSTRTNRPIYDYYMDYGIIFLENRYEARSPEANGRYHPWKTLQNLWQIAPYIPPQKINMEMINDQDGYTPDYLLATVMMANPLLWESLARVTEESRKAMKTAIARYKEHQAAIYSGNIFPIGDMPDGASWTGFQSHDPRTVCGYLIAYREDNPGGSYRFYPKFLAGPTRFESVTDDAPALMWESSDQGIEVALPAERSFRLYRYRLLTDQFHRAALSSRLPSGSRSRCPWPCRCRSCRSAFHPASLFGWSASCRPRPRRGSSAGPWACRRTRARASSLYPSRLWCRCVRPSSIWYPRRASA